MSATDRWEGRQITHVHVAALGPRPGAHDRRRGGAVRSRPRADDRRDAGNGQLGGIAGGLWLMMAFVPLVAACSLTVALVAGLMERRLPFALLRASGVRLGELRRIALLETAVPLVFTVLLVTLPLIDRAIRLDTVRFE